MNDICTACDEIFIILTALIIAKMSRFLIWRLKNAICWWKRAGEKAFKLGKMYNKRHISDALVKIFSNAFANSATLPLLKTFCISCWINSNVRSSLYKAFDIDHCAMDEITNNNLAKCDWRGGIMAGVANKFLSGARKL